VQLFTHIYQLKLIPPTGNYLQDFISYKKYMVGTDEDEDVFYGVCLTPNTDYIKIEIY